MAITTLKDLYLNELKDIYSANEQMLSISGDLGSAAKHEDLVTALKAGDDAIRSANASLKEIAARHDTRVEGEHCKGMEGLVAEARKHGLEEDFEDDDLRDAMIVSQYQRMAHYAIASYGCLAAFAKRLGFDDDASELDTCLQNAYEGDRSMTEHAISEINAAAAR